MVLSFFSHVSRLEELNKLINGSNCHVNLELSVSKNVCAEDVDGQDSNLREGNNSVGNSNDRGDRTASNYLKLGEFDLFFYLR